MEAEICQIFKSGLRSVAYLRIAPYHANAVASNESSCHEEWDSNSSCLQDHTQGENQNRKPLGEFSVSDVCC